MARQDLDAFEKTQEALALLRILELGTEQAEQGAVRDAFMVLDELENSLVGDE